MLLSFLSITFFSFSQNIYVNQTNNELICLNFLEKTSFDYLNNKKSIEINKIALNNDILKNNVDEFCCCIRVLYKGKYQYFSKKCKACGTDCFSYREAIAKQWAVNGVPNSHVVSVKGCEGCGCKTPSYMGYCP